MSQYNRVVTSGNLPPAVPTSFTTQNGTAAPVANILIVNAIDSVENNDNGIISKGGVVGTTVANEVDIVLTNRQTSTVTTTDATPTTVLTFALGAVAGVYYVEGNVTAFDVTDTAGGVYNFVSGARTTGVAATEIGSEFKDSLEEAAMSASDIAVSATGNNLLVTVTGIAGKTIRWNAFITYRFVS